MGGLTDRLGLGALLLSTLDDSSESRGVRRRVQDSRVAIVAILDDRSVKDSSDVVNLGGPLIQGNETSEA